MRLEDLVKEWVERGMSDLASAEYLMGMRPRPLEIIAFHCQQAVEKCLKAYLVSKGEEPDRTHDIGFLLTLTERFDPAFASLVPGCVALTDYAVKLRYPGATVIDETAVVSAISEAKAAVALVQTKL